MAREIVLKRGPAPAPPPDASAAHGDSRPASPPGTPPPPSTSTPRPPKKTDGDLTGRGGARNAQPRKSKGKSKSSASANDPSNPKANPKAAKKRALAVSKGAENDIAAKRVKTEEAADDKLEYVISVDNGMWGTCRARAAQSTDPATVNAEQYWKGAKGHCFKAPSVVAFADDNPGDPDFQGGKKSLFGFDVKPSHKSISFFKVGLDSDARPTDYDNPILKEPISEKLVTIKEPAKNFKAVVAAMRHMYQMEMDQLTDLLGRDGVDDVVIKWMLPHPAACSEPGKALLRQAAKQAGWESRAGDTINQTSESIAAATTCYVKLRRKIGNVAWQRTFKVGTSAPTLDIGSLTIDATTLRVLENDRRLKLGEVCTSQGGRCGTVTLHCEILKVLSDKFGAVFSHLSEKKLGRNAKFFEACEDTLENFRCGEMQNEYRLPLNLGDDFRHEDYDDENVAVRIWGHEIEKALDRWLVYPQKLLKNQWAQAKAKDLYINTTIICGGGSMIPSVYEKLKQFCMRHDYRSVIRPDEPAAAVAVGGLIQGLDLKVLGSRMLRASFGIKIEEEDGTEEMEWFIDKEYTVDTSDKKPIKAIAGHATLSVAEVLNAGAEFEMKIYSYDKSTANPRDPSNSDIEHISSIVIRKRGFSKYLVDKLQLQLGANPGQAVPMDVTVYLGIEPSGQLVFEAKHGRASIGRGPLRFDTTKEW